MPRQASRSARERADPSAKFPKGCRVFDATSISPRCKDIKVLNDIGAVFVLVVVPCVVCMGLRHERRGGNIPSAVKRAVNPNFKGNHGEVAVKGNRLEVAKLDVGRLNIPNQ